MVTMGLQNLSVTYLSIRTAQSLETSAVLSPIRSSPVAEFFFLKAQIRNVAAFNYFCSASSIKLVMRIILTVSSFGQAKSRFKIVHFLFQCAGALRRA
jgi:hypothetical protein